VKVQLDAPKTLAGQELGLHLWLADAELVRRRVEAIRDAQTSLSNAKARLDELTEPDATCAAHVASFVDSGSRQLAVLRDEDPFVQLVLRLPGVAPAGLAPEALKLEGAFATAELDLASELRAAHPVVPLLSVGARLEPLSTAKLGPFSGPASVRLVPGLAVPLSPGRALDVLALGAEPIQLEPSDAGVALLSRGLLREPGCFGVDGDFSLPGSLSSPGVFSAERDGVSLRVHGQRLVLERGGKRGVIALELAAASEPDEARLVDLQRLPDGRLVLVAVLGGNSRPGNAMGMCGAGTELDLVWLLLKPDLTLVRKQIVPVASCFRSIELAAFDGGWAGPDFSAERTTTLRYDPRRPLEGISVSSSPLPSSK
jgi:hypothetical protein